jgi:hypothetical protein
MSVACLSDMSASGTNKHVSTASDNLKCNPAEDSAYPVVVELSSLTMLVH